MSFAHAYNRLNRPPAPPAYSSSSSSSDESPAEMDASPAIKGAWTPAHDTRLCKLALQFSHGTVDPDRVDWRAVAEKLATRKTARITEARFKELNDDLFSELSRLDEDPPDKLREGSSSSLDSPIWTAVEVRELLRSVRKVWNGSSLEYPFPRSLGDPRKSFDAAKTWGVIRKEYLAAVKHSRYPPRTSLDLFLRHSAYLTSPGKRDIEDRALHTSRPMSDATIREKDVPAVVRKVKQVGGDFDRDDAGFEGEISRLLRWAQVREAAAPKASLAEVLRVWVLQRFDLEGASSGNKSQPVRRSSSPELGLSGAGPAPLEVSQDRPPSQAHQLPQHGEDADELEARRATWAEKGKARAVSPFEEDEREREREEDEEMEDGFVRAGAGETMGKERGRSVKRDKKRARSRTPSPARPLKRVKGRYTREEDRFLSRMKQEGVPVEETAKRLNRDKKGVQARYGRMLVAREELKYRLREDKEDMLKVPKRRDRSTSVDSSRSSHRSSTPTSPRSSRSPSPANASSSRTRSRRASKSPPEREHDHRRKRARTTTPAREAKEDARDGRLDRLEALVEGLAATIAPIVDTVAKLAKALATMGAKE
ncbi:hypothetical protein JCM10449v2_007738 [Rhodotorula kratochvilovae]